MGLQSYFIDNSWWWGVDIYYEISIIKWQAFESDTLSARLKVLALCLLTGQVQPMTMTDSQISCDKWKERPCFNGWFFYNFFFNNFGGGEVKVDVSYIYIFLYATTSRRVWSTQLVRVRRLANSNCVDSLLQHCHIEDFLVHEVVIQVPPIMLIIGSRIELFVKSLREWWNYGFDHSLTKLSMYRSLFWRLGETLGTSFLHPSYFERILGCKIGYAHGTQCPKPMIGLRNTSLAHPS